MARLIRSFSCEAAKISRRLRCRRRRRPLHIPVQFPHQIANPQRKHKVAFHGVKDFLRSLVITKSFSPSVTYLSESAGRLGLRGVLLQRPQAATNFLQADAMMGQILDDLEANEIVKRIESLRAPPLGGLDGRSDKPRSSQYWICRRLTPTMRLAILLSYASFMNVASWKMKTTVFSQS